MVKNQSLWEKCRFGKVEEVREALTSGANPNSIGGSDWDLPPGPDTLLNTAASFNQEELVDLLLAQEGIEVNKRGGYHYHTALHIAVGRGSIACVNKLLAAPGIDVNALDNQNKTPIMWAVDQWPVTSGSTEALRLLAADGRVNLDCKFTDKPSLNMGFADGQSLEER